MNCAHKSNSSKIYGIWYSKFFLLLDFFNTRSMNVFHSQLHFLKTALALVLLLVMSNSGQGQTYKPLNTLTATQVSDTILFTGLQAFITKNAAHGNVSVSAMPGSVGRVIRYTPIANFIGLDTFVIKLEFQNAFPFITYQAYKVAVYPSWLNTQPDFAVSANGGVVVIPVLNNDNTSASPLTVSAIPICNQGTATIGQNGEINFTPNAGFHGIAHLNYVVCDGSENCKTENVDISVPVSAAPGTDTLQFATAKNTSLNMPLSYAGYSVFQSPARGTLQMPNPHSFIYKPTKDSIGLDVFVLRNITNQDTTYSLVKINVLNTPSPNKMAMNDYVFTPVNQAIVFNVRENDINGTTSNSITVTGILPLPPYFPGTLEVSYNNVNGQYRFTPNQNFKGIATFKYKVGNSFPGGNNLETAEVSILVNDLVPAAATFNLTTPKETPIVLNYNIPFIGFDFGVNDPANHGSLEIHYGLDTIVINGQTITGYNMLVYTPNAGYVGADEMEINYCISSTGQCQIIKIDVSVLNMNGTFCVDDCVWTGDANYDGVVNARDLLPIGFFMGLAGNERPNAELEWYGQFGDNWNNPFSGFPINLKHADADGDGLVALSDTAALHRFYGNTHNLFPEIPPSFKGDNGLQPGLKLISHDNVDEIQEGDHVELEISLGTAAKPIANLYGFVYKYQINSNWVISNLGMDFYADSWLAVNSPTIGFEKATQSNVLETGFTRTNGLAHSGQGKVAKLDFIIEDIIEGGKPGENALLRILATGGEGMTGDGESLEIADVYLDLKVRTPGKSIEDNEQVAENDLFVFPNPTSDLAIFHLNGNNEINELRIFSPAGREVWNSGNVVWKHAEVSVSDLPNGMYFAVANTSGGRVTKKFQVIR